MSTISTDSHSSRRLTYFTPPQSPQPSPKASQPGTRRASKVITSGPRKRVSFPVFPEEIELPQRQTSWRQTLANISTLWSEFSTAFSRRISIKRLIKVILLIHATVLIIRIIDICMSLGKDATYEREEEYIHGEKEDFRREKKRSTHKHDNRDGLHMSHQLEPYELVSPSYDLANLDIGPQLDVLKDAYSDSRHGLNRLRDTLPDLSKDSPVLSTKLRSFRDRAWTVSEAIGGLSKLFDVYIDKLQRETNHVKKELAKVKPGHELANLNLEDCRKVAVVWINHYKRLKKIIIDVERTKDVFSDVLDTAVEERKDLEKALRKAESVEAELKTKIGGGYEETIKELIRYVDVSLRDANAQIEHLMTDFQRILSVDKNEADVVSIEFPTISGQMEALDLTFEKYKRVKVLVEHMKAELGKELKRRDQDSKERDRYYNYVASQQKGRLDRHIVVSRDRKKEDFLQDLRERRAEQSRKGG
ncbi:hypothetical protein EAE96_009185 [Botrytis aclada]|nr:hypothetical protein EAE96_009185 [Botrytis aclada]